MNPIDLGRMLLRITRSRGIVRRYFVVNGFDGALTMLGLVIGFLSSDPASPSVMINAGLGAAIALGVSGVSSAYVSEVAERQRELERLEQAMVTNLEDSLHGAAVVWVPLLIALVNGSAPLVFALLILAPLWLAEQGIALPWAPLHCALAVALVIVFLLGVFLGRVSGIAWWRSGIKTLLVALATAVLIRLVTGE